MATATPLRLRGVTKAYHGRTVLGPIDLAFEAGRVYGLIGARGGRGLAAARRRMGYMPDASSAYPDLSARENGFATVA